MTQTIQSADAAQGTGDAQGASAHVEADAARRTGSVLAAAQAALECLLSGYALVYFGRRPAAGLLFLLATFVDPWHGAAGISGVLLTEAWARLLGDTLAQRRDGLYAVNGLLVGLGLGSYCAWSVQLVLLLALAALLTVLLTAALRHLFVRYLGVPVLCLPFVLITWIALLAYGRLAGAEQLGAVAHTDVALGLLPSTLDLYLRSLGAAFFQFNPLSGLLVLLGLLAHSRWAVLLSLAGFGAGYATYLLLGCGPGDPAVESVGFNFVLTAIAMGGVWIVLRPGSMLLAIAGGALSGILAAALLVALDPLGLPVLALPFVLTTQLLLLSVTLRAGTTPLQLVTGELESPERNLSRVLYRDRRYPAPGLPVVYLPVMGRWLITQGPHGELTHKGLWAHAWDFEVADDDGSTHRGSGAELSDYYAYGAPVVAPGAGKVVRVVDHVADNDIGEVETRENWGNLVILWHGGVIYSALCHLKPGTIVVKEGERVVVGQVLGHVGNSGRSAVPHLHFQLQASGEIGAPTLKGELLHFLREGPDSPRYVTHAAPSKGEFVTPMEVDEDIRKSTSLAPGRRWEWIVREGESLRREAWTSEIDPVGTRRLESSAGAALTFYADAHYTTLLDYAGRSSCLLGLFYLGAARLPYMKQGNAAWADTPSVVPFLPPWALLIHDLLLPFSDTPLVRAESSYAREGGVKVVTHIERSTALRGLATLPDRIEILFAPGVGPCRLRSYQGERLLISADLCGKQATRNGALTE